MKYSFLELALIYTYFQKKLAIIDIYQLIEYFFINFKFGFLIILAYWYIIETLENLIKYIKINKNIFILIKIYLYSKFICLIKNKN